MTANIAFIYALIGVCSFAFWRAWNRPEMRVYLWRVAGVLSINWALGTFYALQTGNPTPWHFNIFIDVVSAWVITLHPANRWQMIIGCTYCAQILVHCAYGLQDLRPEWSFLSWMPNWHVAQLTYYWTLTWIAFGQLALLGAWSGGLKIGHLLDWLWDRVGSRPDRSHSAGHV